MESKITVAFIALSIAGGLVFWAMSTANYDSRGLRPEELREGEEPLDWDFLSTFAYDFEKKREKKDSPTYEGQIPAGIRALDNAKVVVQGHFSPMEMDEEDRILSGWLTRFPGACCFGQIPLRTEMIWITLVNPEVLEFQYDGTVLVRGSFRVGEVLSRFGYVEYIYGIDADEVLDRNDALTR